MKKLLGKIRDALLGPRPIVDVHRGDTRVAYWRVDSTRQWNWHCADGNGEVVCASNQGYGSERDCIDGIENARDALNRAVLVRKSARIAR